MDRLRAMQMFVRVAELGNFTRAAEEAGLSHGMASAIVQDLEAHLGVQLVRRTTRRLQVTDDGLRYLERARALLADLRELEDDIGGAETSAKGTLRIQAPIGFSRVVLAPALDRLMQAHPGLDLVLFSRSSYPDFVGDNLDAAIFIGELKDEDQIVDRELGTLPLVISGSPSYLARYGIPQVPEDLDRHNCYSVWSGLLNRPLEWRLQKDGVYMQRKVRGNMIFEASDPAVTAALAGGGLLQMISFLVKDEIASGALVPVLLDYLYPGPMIHYMYRRHRHLPRKLRVFEAFLREEFARSMTDFKQILSRTTGAVT